MPSLRRLLPSAAFFFALAAPSHAQVVHKVAEPFETLTWKASDDSSAGGTTTLSQSVPAALAGSKSALNLEARFSGTGFEFMKGVPAAPFVIPGATQSLSVWVKASPGNGWVMQFKDGWGRSEVGGQKLDWNITAGADGTWKKQTFAVPAGWVQPLTIDAVLVHNWGQNDKKATATLGLDNLEIDTDITEVDPETGLLKSWRPSGSPAAATATPTTEKAPVTPLLQVALAATEEHNVFSGTRPAFQLTARNWRPEAATGTLNWKITDPTGAPAGTGTAAVNVEDTLSLPLPLPVSKFGVYGLDTTIAWADGKKTASSQPFALIPVARPLTDAEKDASPYGLNVLGARGQMVGTFAKAGIVWFRDYGFDYEWMKRAKGADKSYGGWPWYPKIMRQYEENNVRVLADLKGAIKPPINGAKNEPNLEWVREIVGIETAFPSIRYFELDNEYDLHAENIKAEVPIDWANYRAYHKKFGEVTRLIGGGQFTAVENGRAGIWPERLRKAVQSGDFAEINVVNSHHYAGIDAPELNVINHNMGFSGDENVLSFFDQLRAAKKAGAADGKPRQHWLTEFGWDTKAGPIVSTQQQAAYLSRGFMMLAAAGTEKGFWYWDYDSPVANQFFDGCGLFTHDALPKLSYAAYAGLTQMLPKPEYLGLINAGENTWGYLFRNEGKLVATLWTLDGAKGPAVDFGTAKVFDAYANPLDKTTVDLGIAPVFAVGVADTSKWAKQAAYSLDSPYLVTATAGDSITTTIQVKNTRNAAIKGAAKLQLPAGWTAEKGDATITVEPGKTALVPLTFRISADEPLGEKTVRLQISEDGPLTVIPLRVQIQRPLLMTVKSLTGEPGESDLTIRVSNRSARTMNGRLLFALPMQWRTTPEPGLPIEDLKPMEVREVHAKINWTVPKLPFESAAVAFVGADGLRVTQPIVPSRIFIAKAPALVMDGDLKDWPKDTTLPPGLFGSTAGDANIEAHAAWSEKGLYFAFDVKDSKAIVPDPKSFWAGDVIELFLDTHANKTARKFGVGDHQFWFAPLIDQKRVYAGRWKRNTEIPETRYDLPGIQGVALRKADGYTMEWLLPAALIQDYKPAAGAKLGLNLNLTIKSPKSDREVFWTLPKSDGVDQPATWGTVTLGN